RRRGAGRLRQDAGGIGRDDGHQKHTDDPSSDPADRWRAAGGRHCLPGLGGPDGCGLLRLDEYTAFFGTSEAWGPVYLSTCRPVWLSPTENSPFGISGEV